MNLNQITVPSIDLNISITFYETLGLKLIVKAMPHYARFECPDGSSTFSIHQVSEVGNGNGVIVYFECPALDAHVAHLVKNGIKFEEMPTDKSWLWREARLYDPDGNEIKLYFGGENRLNPPWRI